MWKILPVLVDSHCHLNFPDFADDRAEVMARAAAAGVGYMLAISTELRKAGEIIATAAAYDTVFASIGTHPNHAAEEPDITLEEILSAAAKPKVVALGECGLDYYRGEQDKDIQQRIFRLHIQASLATGLPLIIHTRAAEEDTIRLLREEGAVNGVIHCFSSSQWLADQALDLGFMISFSGIVTFKNAKDIQETARTVPIERLLVETDAPYLAPVPERGKRNEPAFVAHTAAYLADLKGISKDALAEQTTHNFFRLFTRALPIGRLV
jgi:TatD DNase family protein